MAELKKVKPSTEAQKNDIRQYFDYQYFLPPSERTVKSKSKE